MNGKDNAGHVEHQCGSKKRVEEKQKYQGKDSLGAYQGKDSLGAYQGKDSLVVKPGNEFSGSHEQGNGLTPGARKCSGARQWSDAWSKEMYWSKEMNSLETRERCSGKLDQERRTQLAAAHQHTLDTS